MVEHLHFAWRLELETESGDESMLWKFFGRRRNGTAGFLYSIKSFRLWFMWTYARTSHTVQFGGVVVDIKQNPNLPKAYSSTVIVVSSTQQTNCWKMRWTSTEKQMLQSGLGAHSTAGIDANVLVHIIQCDSPDKLMWYSAITMPPKYRLEINLRVLCSAGIVGLCWINYHNCKPVRLHSVKRMHVINTNNGKKFYRTRWKTCWHRFPSNWICALWMRILAWNKWKRPVPNSTIPNSKYSPDNKCKMVDRHLAWIRAPSLLRPDIDIDRSLHFPMYHLDSNNAWHFLYGWRKKIFHHRQPVDQN